MTEQQTAFRQRLKLIGGQTLVDEYDALHAPEAKEEIPQSPGPIPANEPLPVNPVEGGEPEPVDPVEGGEPDPVNPVEGGEPEPVDPAEGGDVDPDKGPE